MIAEPMPFLSPEEYLAFEETADVRHEYLDGEIFAMAGSSSDHASLVGNIFVVLSPFVRGQGCRIYPQDVKAKIEEKSRYYYPDILVTCDARDREERYVKQHYTLIVEVLSEGTEAFDRGKKFEDYRRTESLEEYVLVAQDRVCVEVFRRKAKGRWELESYGVGDEVRLESLGARFAIEQLYIDVDIPPEPPLLSSGNV
ncbi:MAG: Uma2 family endonuclease [Synechococcales cyanobacterium CRU_2_2]|nr:Uma2 family endonuclease [Synechococcales cyanobacterium CRU_2_2]